MCHNSHQMTCLIRITQQLRELPCKVIATSGKILIAKINMQSICWKWAKKSHHVILTLMQCSLFLKVTQGQTVNKFELSTKIVYFSHFPSESSEMAFFYKELGDAIYISAVWLQNREKCTWNSFIIKSILHFFAT